MSVAPPEAAARRREGLATFGLYAGSVTVALVLCAVLVAATGGPWRNVFSAMLDGSIRSPGAWGLTLTTAAPLLIVALGTILATKAGLVNIGQEGQVLLGAAGTVFVATKLGGPGPVVLVAALVAGIVAGAAWAAIAAGMRYGRSVPEVISTLLLVFVAFQFVSFGLTRTWLFLDPEPRINKLNFSAALPAGSRLPALQVFGNRVGSGVFIAVALAVLLGFLVTRTVWGFRMRMLGLNQRTAQRAGVSARTYGGAALIASGGLAGLAGGVLLTSGAAGDKLTSGYSSNVGWQGLLLALVARDHPIVAIPLAFVFAALRTGSGFLAATGVERRIADVVQASLVLALLFPPALAFVRERRRTRRALAATATAAARLPAQGEAMPA